MKSAIKTYLKMLMVIFVTLGIISTFAYAEEKLTIGLSCFEIGYRFGKCATLSLRGKTCEIQDDVIVPERCRNNSETNRGILEGTKGAYK